jgi:hypothetical protein
MTVTVSNLIASQTAATTATTYFTCPAGSRVIIDKLTATNTTGATVQVTCNIINSGSSVGAANTITSAQNVAAGASYLFAEVAGHVMEAGQQLSLNASATGLTIRASGRVVT